MLVPEAFKSAAYHFIRKKVRGVKLCYFGGKVLAEKEMR